MFSPKNSGLTVTLPKAYGCIGKLDFKLLVEIRNKSNCKYIQP